MDYTKENFLFKLKKALRYLSIDGPSRTLIKIMGQYHMNKSYQPLPKNHLNDRKKAHVGIIGAGNFSYSNVAYFLRKNYGKVIRGVMDIEINRAASLFEKYDLIYYTDKISDIIDDDKINLVYIASNHFTHAEYAILALERGKIVHIEKPHVVNRDQLDRLVRAMETYNGKVRIGFNRPGSRFGRIIQEYLKKETGTIMINWFVAGHKIDPDHWYFHKNEGGRILGNLCHWTDFTYQMIPDELRYPIRIIPSRSEKADCDISVTYIFGDGSIATITFSAKGHTFEGVREKLNLHKGNVLVSMSDYETLRIDIADKKKFFKNLFRDHGHERNIKRSYELSSNNSQGESIKYIYESADLFLKTKEALESQKEIIVQSYELSSSAK